MKRRKTRNKDFLCLSVHSHCIFIFFFALSLITPPPPPSLSVFVYCLAALMMMPFFLPLHVVLQRQAPVQRCLERLLYVWAVKHPASGYVQGINDLATPLLVVFLSAALLPPKESSSSSSPSSSFNEAGSSSAASAAATSNSSNSSGRCPLTTAVECLDSGKLPVEVLAAAEADTYWCLTKLLDNIQVMLLILHPPLSVDCLSSPFCSCILIMMLFLHLYGA